MTFAPEHDYWSNSPIGRIDARWRLAALLMSAAAFSLLHTCLAGALAFLASQIVVILARLPWKWYAARLGGIATFLVFFVLLLPFLHDGQSERIHWGPMSVSSAGLTLGLLICLKALAIVSIMLTIIGSASLNDTLKAAHALKVPGLLIQLALLSFRYVYVVSSELARLRVALRVRGYRNRANRHSYRTAGHVAGTLLVRGYERAERVGQAMRCRGFDGRFRSLRDFRTRFRDVVFFVVVVTGAALLLLWDFLLT